MAFMRVFRRSFMGSQQQTHSTAPTLLGDGHPSGAGTDAPVSSSNPLLSLYWLITALAKPAAASVFYPQEPELGREEALTV